MCVCVSEETVATHTPALEHCRLPPLREGVPKDPKGPKIDKFQDRPPGLKFSSEIEYVSSEQPTKPLFLLGLPKVKIEIFNRD